MSKITNEEMMASLELGQNVQHQFLIGELASALNIAMNALSDIADRNGILESMKAKKKASQAIKSIQDLGEWIPGRDPFNKERLEDLQKDFFHIRHFNQSQRTEL